MPEEQLAINSVISIEVIDNPTLNFSFDTIKKLQIPEYDSNPACKIKVNESSFRNLVEGDSTFEREVQTGFLRVEGDHQLLRTFGQTIRKSSESS